MKIAARGVELGFTQFHRDTHVQCGQLKPLGRMRRTCFEEVMAMGKRAFPRFKSFSTTWGAREKNHHWRCRSGRLSVYICEDGLVHWARSSAVPGIPLPQLHSEMRPREDSH